MSNALRDSFITALRQRFGGVSKLAGSQSLYDLTDSRARIYIRYSRVHHGRQTFYGLRKEDLKHLEGKRAFICFLWDGQQEPLILPFEEYEDIFHDTTPAKDGQYKTHVLLRDEGTELYIARAGRFNVDASLGWDHLEAIVRSGSSNVPPLTHPQVQTLLGAIGTLKHFDIWIPPKDRDGLDWSVADRFRCMARLPYDDLLQTMLHEIDAVWLHRGSSRLAALYEVEHSTPVYSGLLRLNDVHLAIPSIDRLAIVSNEIRRSLFVRQLRRPTFQRSGFSEACTFLNYSDVFEWQRRLRTGTSPRDE
jgi:hypothetical protein